MIFGISQKLGKEGNPELTVSVGAKSNQAYVIL